MDDNDTIDGNDDPCTQLLKFLDGKITPEDMSTVEPILSGVMGLIGDEPPDTQGAPRAPNTPGAPRLNPVTRGAMDGRRRADTTFDRLFPDAPKLRRV